MSLRIASPQNNQIRENGRDSLQRNRPGSRDVSKGRRIQATQESFQTQRTAKLEIQTREGDTVTLSFAAQSSSESQSLKTPELDAQSRKSSSSLSFNLSVEGNLSDAEVADIQKVLAGLNDPGTPSTDLGSLSGYIYAYQSSSTYSASALSYRG